jgi:hypothetical protein
MFCFVDLHQREANWPTTAVNAVVTCRNCYLWEDARQAEKLDAVWKMYARRPETIWITAQHCARNLALRAEAGR